MEFHFYSPKPTATTLFIAFHTATLPSSDALTATLNAEVECHLRHPGEAAPGTSHSVS